MSKASIHELRKEISGLDPKELSWLLLRLAKYKKDNKELLAYLLFDQDEETFLVARKAEISALFNQLPSSSYQINKSLRKITQLINKYVKFSDSKHTEVELRLAFCRFFKQFRLSSVGSTTNKIYLQQLKSIGRAMTALHDDLKHDYKVEWSLLEAELP